jgi:hypothetical protein
MKTIILLLILSCFLVGSTQAIDKVAQSKMQFLKLGVGARAAALGDAFTAISGDPNAIFYNPAGTAYLTGLHLAVNKTDWIADIEHLSGVIAWEAKKFGVFTLNWMNVEYGSMTKTVVDNHAWVGYLNLGEFEVTEYAVGLGYAKTITDRFSIGGQVKYVYQDLGATETWWYLDTDFENHKFVNNHDHVIAFDLGTYYDAGFRGITMGMAVQNFANKAIPLTFRFGLSLELNKLLLNQQGDHRFILSWDGLHPRDYGERMHFGLEYKMYQNYFLRMGYKTNYDEEDFTAGAGVNLNLKGVGLSCGYAFTNFGIFGHVNRFTVSLNY